ncbi:MAG: hypothetical protein ACQKBY_05800, partial [Verrucomicrobiales bacterium]
VEGGASFSQPTTPAGLETFVREVGLDGRRAQAKWVSYETDDQGRQWRYAFWVEGLNAYIDGDLAALEDRGLGESGRELPWYSFSIRRPMKLRKAVLGRLWRTNESGF